MMGQSIDKPYTPQNEHLVSLIDGLRVAKERHYSWLWDIHRSLLCEIPLFSDVATDPAHCAFAEWLHSVADEPLVRHSETYQQIHEQHLKMHQSANLLITTAARQRPIPVAVYDDFIEQRNHFKEVVEQFERDLWGMACLVDQLTGLRNRFGMLTDLFDEQQRVVREHSNCSIAMIDIDHFKTINDNYGHQTGDLLLVKLAKLLSSKLRPYDHLYRYGGEEFLICLPGTDIDEAREILERMRHDITVMKFSVDNNPIPISASFGLTPIGRESCIEDYIEHADAALYAAKAAGRNRVMVYNIPYVLS
jgi:diguanylate cyclase (GGDEF)-like protein